MKLEQLIAFLSGKTDQGKYYIVTKVDVNQEDLSILETLYDEDCLNEIYKGETQCVPSGISIGDSIIIYIHWRKLRKYGYYHDLESYFTDRINDKVKTAIAYIAEISAYSDNEVEALQKIEFALKVREAMTKVFACDSSGNILMQGTEIRKISSSFEMTSLDGITLGEYSNRALRYLQAEDEIIHIIYKQGLCEFYDNYNSGTLTLSTLFEHFQEYAGQCNNSTILYLKQFSFKDTKAQIDKTISEYADKTQSIVTSTQARLIAIPGAFVLGICSLDYLSTWSIRNCAILASSAIFVLLIWVFIRNQKDALRTLRESIERYKKLVNSEFTQSETKIKSLFETLDKQTERQNKRLNLISGIIWLIPLLTGFVIGNGTLFCEMMETISRTIAGIIAAIPAFIAGILM